MFGNLLAWLTIIMLVLLLFIGSSKTRQCKDVYARQFVHAHVEYVCAR